MRRYTTLITNHADAWGVTFIIASLPLILNRHTPPSAIALLLAITAGYWFGFAVNDYFDRAEDARDPHKATRNLFAMVGVPRTVLWGGSAVFLAGQAMVFAQFGGMGIGVWVGSIAVAWAYSAPPLRLKTRPGADLITHMLFVQTYPYALTLLLNSLPFSATDAFLLGMFACASLAAQLEQQIRDVAVDSEPNFTQRVGVPLAALMMRLASGGVGLLIFIGVVTGNLPALLLPFILAALPVFAYRYFRRADRPRSQWLVNASLSIGGAYLVVLWLVTAAIA